MAGKSLAVLGPTQKYSCYACLPFGLGHSESLLFYLKPHDNPLVAWFLPDFSPVAEPAHRPDPAA
jgi:hypothetical protein